MVYYWNKILSELIGFGCEFRFPIDREDWLLVYHIPLYYTPYQIGIHRKHQFLLVDSPSFNNYHFKFLSSSVQSIIGFFGRYYVSPFECIFTLYLKDG
jgi:hypothetical protein